MRCRPLSALIIMMLALLICSNANAAPKIFSHGFHWGSRSPMADVYFFPQETEFHHNAFLFNSWGKMSYTLWGKQFHFNFQGFNLERRQNYTLLYYPDPQNGAELICLGSARTDRRGALHISARVDTCSLPRVQDANYPSGAQIMLVPSADVICESGYLADPENAAYLLSYHFIRFTDTDGCADESEVTNPEGETGSEEETGGGTEETDGSSDGQTGDNVSDGLPY